MPLERLCGRRSRSGAVRIGAVALLGVALLAPMPGQATGEEAPRATPAEGPYPGSPGSFADLTEGLVDAVINISTSQTVGRAEGIPTPQVPPGSPFEEFFEEFERESPGERRRRVSSLGSGFVIDPSGIIVTNNHVIADADEIVANFNDGRALPAEVLGRDQQTDLALLKVESDEPLPAVSFGDSDTLRVGDWVLAIGNPFGLGGTVTAGIVSAQQRDINAGPYDSFIQTDASINRGNSGGPLFDMHGVVVGVNTAIISPTGSSVGIGFAIPASIARSVIDQLLEFGETRRGWLGVRIQSVGEDIAESLGLDRARGALIAGVSANGPAGVAGIETGDVILEFNGREVADMRSLPRIVADTPVGSEVDVKLMRDGEERTVQVTVGRLEESQDQVAALTPDDEEAGPEPGRVSALGLDLADLTDDLRERYRISDDIEGAVVTDVHEGGIAAGRQIRPGDVVIEVSQAKVAGALEVQEELRRLRERGRDTALLVIANAGGDLRIVLLPLEEEEAEPEAEAQ